jgi:hypothetical protein
MNPHVSSVPSAYGHTIFGQPHKPFGVAAPTIPGTNQSCPCAFDRFCPLHSKAEGPNAKAGTAGARYIPWDAGTDASPSPHDQIAQLVAGFLDGLIGQITARVVRELEPVLAEQAQLFRDLMMMQHSNPPETIPTEMICRRCLSTSCKLSGLRAEIEAVRLVVEGNNDWAWSHWSVHPCAMRIAIGSRLFYVDQPHTATVYGSFVIAEITNGTANAPKCRSTTVDGIADVIRLLSNGSTFTDAIQLSNFLLTEDPDYARDDE